jgi:hypothetical protein
MLSTVNYSFGSSFHRFAFFLELFGDQRKTFSAKKIGQMCSLVFENQ